MTNFNRQLLIAGALILAFSIGMGAMGAHAFKKSFSPQELETYLTGIRYLTLHGVAALALAGPVNNCRPCLWATWSTLGGSIIFGLFCILYAITKVKTFVHIVPVGGLIMIIGWVTLAILFSKRSAQTRSATGP